MRTLPFAQRHVHALIRYNVLVYDASAVRSIPARTALVPRVTRSALIIEGSCMQKQRTCGITFTVLEFSPQSGRVDFLFLFASHTHAPRGSPRGYGLGRFNEVHQRPGTMFFFFRGVPVQLEGRPASFQGEHTSAADPDLARKSLQIPKKRFPMW